MARGGRDSVRKAEWGSKRVVGGWWWIKSNVGRWGLCAYIYIELSHSTINICIYIVREQCTAMVSVFIRKERIYNVHIFIYRTPFVGELALSRADIQTLYFSFFLHSDMYVQSWYVCVCVSSLSTFLYMYTIVFLYVFLFSSCLTVFECIYIQCEYIYAATKKFGVWSCSTVTEDWISDWIPIF